MEQLTQRLGDISIDIAAQEEKDWQHGFGRADLQNHYYESKQRDFVEKLIHGYPAKNIKKKQFIVISTNVLCCDPQTVKEENPATRDLYLPLEITMAKWSMQMATKAEEERCIQTKHWMIDPGKVPAGCVNDVFNNRKLHKIDYEGDTNDYIETDLVKVMREINAFLNADRLVFSTTLEHSRQDLGVLKWLNVQTSMKTKPIKVYNLVDLLVVLVRKFSPSVGRNLFGKGIAMSLLRESTYDYDPKNQCSYHRAMRGKPDSDTKYCTAAIAINRIETILDQLGMFME